jgi:hypothetical protein
VASTSVRSFLAGTGASGSLLLAGLVALVSVTAFVGFDAVPFGSGDAGSGTVSLERSQGAGAAAASAAAAAVAGAPAAVAAAPAAPPAAPGAPAPAVAAAGGTGGGTAPGGAPPITGAPGGGGGTQTDIPPAPTPTAAAPTNPVDDLVTGVDDTVETATGINPNLGGTTKPVTGLVDQTIQNLTGNNLGGHLDNLGLRPQP